jgi:hypothetical protein
MFTSGGVAIFTAGLFVGVLLPVRGKATRLFKFKPVFFIAPVLGLIPFIGGNIGGSFQPRPGVGGALEDSGGLSAASGTFICVNAYLFRKLDNI